MKTDPLAFRHRNALGDGDPGATGQCFEGEVLRPRLSKMQALREARPAAAPQDGRLHGRATTIGTWFVFTGPSIGPLGTKGAGEVPILNVGATIACAVANATGKRVQELPLTPPRLLALLLDRSTELAFPHIASRWADNLRRPHGEAG